MRTRSLVYLFLVVSLIATNGCIVAFASIRGSGDVVSRQENFDDFDSLRVSHGCQVSVSQSQTYSVVVRIDDNLEQYLDVHQSGSSLRIGLDSDHSYRNVHCDAEVRMPDLREMRLSGGSRGYLQDFRARNDLEFGLSGGSRLEGLIQGERIQIGTSGGAQVELRGRSESLRLDGSGGSQMRLSELEAGSVDVTMSGGSGCTIHLNGELTGSLSGGSSVHYSGTPTEIRVSKSGGARVSRQ